MVSKDDVNVDKPGIGKNILQASVHPRRNHAAVAGLAGSDQAHIPPRPLGRNSTPAECHVTP